MLNHANPSNQSQPISLSDIRRGHGDPDADSVEQTANSLARDSNSIRTESSNIRLRAEQHIPLGRQAKKARADAIDLSVILLSGVCLALAMLTIHNKSVAWNLGYNNQLVIIGFLLSIMNMCLLYIAPTLLLQCEARFGRSTLQNLDAILRWKPLGSKLDWWWRITLMFL